MGNNMQIRNLIFTVPLVSIFLLGNKCAVDNMTGQPYIVNYSTIASRSLNEKDKARRGLQGLEQIKRGDFRFPFYIDEIARVNTVEFNDQLVHPCDNGLIGSVGGDVQLIIDNLAKSNSFGNVLLVGADADVRVFALAERLNEKKPQCGNVPNDLVNPQIIAIDFDKLNKENSGLSGSEYIAFIQSNILNVFGGNNIFYLNNIEATLRAGKVDPQSLLSLFLNYETKMILEISKDYYKQVFDNKVMRTKFSEVILENLFISELETYLMKMSELEFLVSGLKFSHGSMNVLSRLTRAFSGNVLSESDLGELELAMKILSRVYSRTGELGVVSEDSIVDAVSFYTNLSDILLKNSIVMNKKPSGDFVIDDLLIDYNVKKDPLFFVKHNEVSYLLSKVAETLQPQFDELSDDIAVLDAKVDETSEQLKEILAQIKSSTKSLSDKLSELSNQLTLSEAAIIANVVNSGILILDSLQEKYEELSLGQNLLLKGQEDLVVKLLETQVNINSYTLTVIKEAEQRVTKNITEAQLVLLGVLGESQNAVTEAIESVGSDLNNAINQVQMSILTQLIEVQKDISTNIQTATTEAKQDLLARLSAAQRALGESIGSVDTKIDTVKTVMLQELVTVQTQIVADIKTAASVSEQNMLTALGDTQTALAESINAVDIKNDATKTWMLETLVAVQTQIAAVIKVAVTDSQQVFLAQQAIDIKNILHKTQATTEEISNLANIINTIPAQLNGVMPLSSCPVSFDALSISNILSSDKSVFVDLSNVLVTKCGNNCYAISGSRKQNLLKTFADNNKNPLTTEFMSNNETCLIKYARPIT